MKNIFKFKNKDLSANGFHALRALNDAYGSEEDVVCGFHVPNGTLNDEQRGRSMVEMLGVLAVIGVLSIGGIAGYRMAMNKYNANRLMDAVQLGMLNYVSAIDSGMGFAPYTIKWTDEEVKSFFPELAKLSPLYSQLDIHETTQGISIGLYVNDAVWMDFCQLSPALDGVVTKFQVLASGHEDEKAMFCSDCTHYVQPGWHPEKCQKAREICEGEIEKYNCGFGLRFHWN